jgi:separase
MPSLQSSVELIRTALISTPTCSNATTTALSELLFPTTPAPIAKAGTKSAVEERSRGAKASTRSRGKSVDQGKTQDHANQLSPSERSILATEVINVALKVLSEAIKVPASLSGKNSSKDSMKASNHQVLRRSNSLSQTPLQPRLLNRVSSSPDISTRNGRSSSSASIIFAGNRCVAECARLAFAYLRSVRSSKTSGIHLPPLQLENGMSVLVGKLVSLGLDDLALKEIRILRRRLDVDETQLGMNRPAAKAQQPSTLPQTLVELLDFGNASFSGAKLALVITTQLQVLRLMASLRDFKCVRSVLPILQPSHSSSPTRLLLIAAKGSNPRKCVRQLQSLSETLLSLCPSISQADDIIALECRSSVAPEIAMRLQILALHNRVQWWRLAGHTGDLAKELFDPFLRCLSAFARRAQGTSLETYQLSVSGFLALQNELSDLDGLKACTHRSTLLGIYRLLGSLSREASLIDEAISWTQKIQALLDPKTDSEVRHSAVAARLVGLALRGPGKPEDEEQLLVLLDSLERPFKGASSEIDELLTEVSAIRRAAVAIIAKTSPTAYDLTDGMREMCESLILLCPRLSLRYLGPPFNPKWDMKELIRYEQRRKFITKVGKHAIDSALFLVKTLLGKGRLTWEVMDSKLQDCLLLLERIDGHSDKITAGYEPLSYYVRISDLYFSQFLNMERESGKYKDGQRLQAIRRSIDAVRSRPQHEKRAALLSTKLERMAEACRIHGRYDELFKTLVTHRDELVSNGVLSKVSAAAATRPILAAWSQDEETMILGRIIQSLVKVQMKHLSSVTQSVLLNDSWTEQERGVVLEHCLEILSSESNVSLGLQIKVFQALLFLYDQRKYPIRRLRVISRLLSLGATQREAVFGQDIADGSDIRKVELVIEGTRDEGLQGYLLHFQALNASLLELQQNQPRIDVLKQSLKVWSSIRAGCQSLISLELQIEDLPVFLDHLQSIADLMEVKGLDAIRLATIRLVKDFHEIRDESAFDDNFVLSLVHLGNQWSQLGYSGRAGLTLDRAQARCRQNGAMQCTLLQLHLAYAEYLLSVGSLDKWYVFIRERFIALPNPYLVTSIYFKPNSVSWEERTTTLNGHITGIYRRRTEKTSSFQRRTCFAQH